LRRSCHLTQLASRFVSRLASRLASQQCTQMTQNGAEGPFPPICVHSCVPTRLSATAPQPNSVHKRPEMAPRGPILPFVYTTAIPRPPTTQAHGATVYTNAPKRLRGAISSHLCTLLRSQGHPQPKPTAQQCTQTPQNGAKRPDPPICVHYCDPKASHNPSPRPNSVHKCPETAPRGHFGQSVYTPASSPWR